VAAVTTAGAASQSLAQAMPSLEKVSSNIHDTSKKTIAELTRLSEHLDAAVAEKKPLLDTIEKQASEIKTLSQENQGLKTALTRAHSCLLFFANQGEAPGAQNGGPTTSHNDTPALR
jgi:t-SNARE complex subunit (syntaxin)